MFRATLYRYSALVRAQGEAGWRAAQSVGRDIRRRNLDASPQSFARQTLSTLRTLPPRSGIANSAQKVRASPLRSARRDFHNTSSLRDAKGAPKKANGSSKSAEPQGLTARLKKLSREYGWAALGVYMGLSVIDFPLCFLLVRVIGTDKIGEFEHWIVSHAKQLIPQGVKDEWHEYRQALSKSETENFGNEDISKHVEMAGWGVEEAEARNKAEASLGTQLALAYAIHKTFIFVRVPLTAAVTPKVVKVLRSWGWNIGKRRPRATREWRK